MATPINGNQYWYATALHPQNQRKDTISVDYNVTDKHRIQFRRMGYSFWEYQPLDGGTPFTPKYFDRPNQTNSLNYVWTVSPTMVNEMLGTVSVDRVFIPVDTANFLDRTKVGINYPYIFPEGKLINTRIPTVNMQNFSGLSGGPYPSHSQGPIYTFSDSFTWLKSNHTFKFGFAWERSGENDNDEINVSACPTCTNNQNGQFSFHGHPLRSADIGRRRCKRRPRLFDTYSELGQRAYTLFRGSMWEGFAQDSWKVTQKLHIDYGIRYTVIVPFSATWRNMIVFDRSFYDPAKAVSINPDERISDRRQRRPLQRHGHPRHRLARFRQGTFPGIHVWNV